MRKINKGAEPGELKEWKQQYPHGKYNELTAHERTAVRKACTLEQGFLCAYCCDSISGTASDTMNEHVEAQKLAPHRTLDFNNIVASCKAPHHCDRAHKSQPLPLTPFMLECETELVYKISGRVSGTSERAREAIRVLNLGDTEGSNKALIEKRKRLCDALLWANGIDPDEGLDDDDLIMSVIGDLLDPKDQRLDAFAPVLVNMMRGWLER